MVFNPLWACNPQTDRSLIVPPSWRRTADSFSSLYINSDVCEAASLSEEDKTWRRGGGGGVFHALSLSVTHPLSFHELSLHFASSSRSLSLPGLPLRDLDRGQARHCANVEQRQEMDVWRHRNWVGRRRKLTNESLGGVAMSLRVSQHAAGVASASHKRCRCQMKSRDNIWSWCGNLWANQES